MDHTSMVCQLSLSSIFIDTNWPTCQKIEWNIDTESWNLIFSFFFSFAFVFLSFEFGTSSHRQNKINCNRFEIHWLCTQFLVLFQSTYMVRLMVLLPQKLNYCRLLFLAVQVGAPLQRYNIGNCFCSSKIKTKEKRKKTVNKDKLWMVHYANTLNAENTLSMLMMMMKSDP